MEKLKERLGKQLLTQSKLLLDQMTHLEKMSISLVDGIESKLTIGLSHMLPLSLLKDTLKQVQQQFPFTQVRLVRGTVSSLLAKLNDGEYQIVLHDEFNGASEFETQPFSELSISYICSHSHPLSQYNAASNKLISQYPQVLCRATRAHSVFGEVQAPTENSWFTDNSSDTLQLVSKGVGWAIMPTAVLDAHSAFHQFQREEATGSTIRTYITTSSNRAGTPAQEYATTLLKAGSEH
ncbi:substrate-binding domain-containing protein [Vibrio methylphosphonaticus]|uniref:substrate-binding domain-containing protein n=1 Tax=Vibrio methylphosphonaticus TaxID=2946866 RepID=UPI00202A9D81|nr:substrate-binding domain-containing protein [Vibrio methylphosphonaticus]MCL9774015.1 substrate-binding domain-containing protein [Vibrio methylphosphonaticus]